MNVVRKSGRKILVCGGRDYTNAPRVDEVLAALHSEEALSCIVHGGARGADRLAELWARVHNIPTKEYRAEWEVFGRRAGHVRNCDMLNTNPDIALVVAFPGGVGTADMKKQALVRGVKVYEVKD